MTYTRRSYAAVGLRRLLPGLGLFALGLLIGSVTLRNWIQLNDEGLMLQASARIADGQVPYRDFWWFYPPGQPYLLALVWKLAGPSLIPWRVLRAVADASVALLAWRLARRRSGPLVALFAWCVSILAVSSATGPHPYPIALALGLGSILALGRYPAVAGGLLGLMAVWRIEFAAYLALASVVGMLVRGGAKSSLIRFICWSAGISFLCYLPVVIAAGAGRTWELLVRYPVLEFSKYQTLPFPLVWDGGGRARGSDLVAQFLSYHLPLVLLVTLVASVTVFVVTNRSGRWIEVTGSIFGVGMAHYMVVRADAFHLGPLAVVDAVLGAWAIGAVVEQRRTRGKRQAATGRLRPRIALIAAAVAGFGLTWTLADTGWKRVREVEQARSSRAIGIKVADGVRELPSSRCSLRGATLQTCSLSDLEQAVRETKRRVPVGRPIYVTTKRSDLVTAGAPLFYVLAERPNATRYDIAAPGVVTSAPVQREIIANLRSTRALVIRDSESITAAPEPNRAGQSSGVTLLDDWLAANYRVVARFGAWTLLAPDRSAIRDGREAR